MANASFTNTKFVGMMQLQYNLKLLVKCLSESDMKVSMYTCCGNFFSITKFMEITFVSWCEILDHPTLIFTFQSYMDIWQMQHYL